MTSRPGGGPINLAGEPGDSGPKPGGGRKQSTPALRASLSAGMATVMPLADDPKARTAALPSCPAADAPPTTREKAVPKTGPPCQAALSSQVAGQGQGEGMRARLAGTSSSISSLLSAIIFAGHHSGASARKEVAPGATLSATLELAPPATRSHGLLRCRPPVTLAPPPSLHAPAFATGSFEPRPHGARASSNSSEDIGERKEEKGGAWGVKASVARSCAGPRALAGRAGTARRGARKQEAPAACSKSEPVMPPRGRT